MNRQAHHYFISFSHATDRLTAAPFHRTDLAATRAVDPAGVRAV